MDPRVRRSREKVLAAALELLADGGYTAATVEAVSARSGVAKTTVYRQWPHRAALVVSALQSLGPPPPAPRLAAAAGTDPAVARAAVVDAVRGVLLGLVTGLRGGLWAGLLPVLVGAAEGDVQLRAEITALVAARRSPLVDLLREARAAGVVAGCPREQDLEGLADLLEAPLYYRRYFAGGALDEAAVDAAVAAALTPHLP